MTHLGNRVKTFGHRRRSDTETNSPPREQQLTNDPKVNDPEVNDPTLHEQPTTSREPIANPGSNRHEAMVRDEEEACIVNNPLSEESLELFCKAIQNSPGFLTVDHQLYGHMIKGYTLKERQRLMFKISEKLQPKDTMGVNHQFIKTYFSWPLNFPSMDVSGPGSKHVPDGTVNKVITASRKVYPVFSENSGPNECQSYFEGLRDQFASGLEKKYNSGFSPTQQNEDDQPEHEKQQALEVQEEYRCILDNLTVSPIVIPDRPLEKDIEDAFKEMIAFVCRGVSYVADAPLMQHAGCGESSALKSDIVFCTTGTKQPLLFVEMKKRNLAHFLNKDYSIKKIPIHPDEAPEPPKARKRKLTVVSDAPRDTGAPGDTGASGVPGAPDTSEFPRLPDLPDLEEPQNAPSQEDIMTWLVAMHFIRLINQAYTYMINYGKKWCFISDLGITFYIEIDTESQMWKDIVDKSKRKSPEPESEPDLSKIFVKIPMKCRVISIKDTNLTLQTIFMSLLHKEQSECKDPSNDDKHDSNKSVAKVLKDLVKRSAEDLKKYFGKAQRFNSKLSDAFDRQGGNQRVLPKHTGNVESVEHIALQHGPQYLSQVLLFDAAKLKQYIPTLNIPDSGKVVMKIYDELLIQDYADLDHEQKRPTEEWFGLAGLHFVREISSYQRISSCQRTSRSNEVINVPQLYDFGAFVLLEKSELKFSGLFMLMSYIEPDPEQKITEQVRNEVSRSVKSLHSIGIEHNDIVTRNIVVSNSDVYMIDFSHATLDSTHEDSFEFIESNRDSSSNESTLVSARGQSSASEAGGNIKGTQLADLFEGPES